MRPPALDGLSRRPFPAQLRCRGAGIESPANQWYGAADLVSLSTGIRVLSYYVTVCVTACHSPIIEQRMLTRSRALYADPARIECPWRGLRAPTARRRSQGAALFIIGLGMLVCFPAWRSKRP